MGRTLQPASCPADRVLRARLREPVRFPDLSERGALKLSAVAHYTARAHFGLWHRRMGTPNFSDASGIFTPLVYVELETADLPINTSAVLQVRGETSLARTVDDSGATARLLREGRYALYLGDAQAPEPLVARASLINLFTRYDANPDRRRVTELPDALGLGKAPSRVAQLPSLDTLVPAAQPPDCTERDVRVWHYGHTDPNRHVSGMEYLRSMESYVAEELHRRGQDLRRMYFSRARIVYRKPCFRGEGYRRVAWFRSEAPLTISGAFVKADDPPHARPAVAVELTVLQHPSAE